MAWALASPPGLNPDVPRMGLTGSTPVPSVPYFPYGVDKTRYPMNDSENEKLSLSHWTNGALINGVLRIQRGNVNFCNQREKKLWEDTIRTEMRSRGIDKEVP